MLLRLRKNSTSTTEPSESLAVAVKFVVEAVVALVGTLSVTVGASPDRFETTTLRDTALVALAATPMFACVTTEYVSAAVGIQIARYVFVVPTRLALIAGTRAPPLAVAINCTVGTSVGSLLFAVPSRKTGA